MMIGIGAMVLVTFLILNFNRGSLSTQDVLIYNKELIVATTVAQSMLDELSSKFFDEEIAEGNHIYFPNDLSNNLTTDSAEVYPNFDDIDDYNNFARIDTIPQMGVFNISIQVDYMTDGLAKTAARAYNKNVTIKVTSPSLVNLFTEEQDTVEIQSLFSQWTLL